MKDHIYQFGEDASSIQPILDTFEELGLSLTDKAIQSLILAGKDAIENRYKSIYDDSILTGLIRSQSIVANLLFRFGIDPSLFIKKVHEPLPVADDKGSSYVKEHTIYVKEHTIRGSQRRRRRQFTTLGYERFEYALPSWCPPGKEWLYIKPLNLPLPRGIIGAKGMIGTDALFSSVLQMPVVWHYVHRTGLSVNKIKRQISILQIIEPDIETQKYVLSYEDGMYRFRPFDFMDAASIAYHEEHPDRGIIICRANIVTPLEYALNQQIKEFENLINKTNVSEYDIQRFLEQYPEFLLGLEHKKMHSQLTLVRERSSDLRPDFFLERIDGNLCDIADLKLPSSRLVVGKPNRRTFSAAVISALGQLAEYGRYFDDSHHRKDFNKKYGLMAYKPSLYVVIGRSSDFAGPIERAALQEELSHLKILTYDDILLRAERRIEIYRS